MVLRLCLIWFVVKGGCGEAGPQRMPEFQVALFQVAIFRGGWG